MISSKSVQDVHGIVAPQVRGIAPISRSKVARGAAGYASLITPALIGKLDL